MNTMTITSQVMEAIRQTIGARPAECGGMLGTDGSGKITHYYFDATGCGTPNSYEPDVKAVNEMLSTDWLPKGIRLAGIVHSHTDGNEIPSCGDIHYGMRILQALDDLEWFYLPIVTGQGENMTLSVFAMKRDDRQTFCRKLEYRVL